MKTRKLTQVELLKGVRKQTIFVGKAHGSPKGKRGYNRARANDPKGWK